MYSASIISCHPAEEKKAKKQNITMLWRKKCSAIFYGKSKTTNSSTFEQNEKVAENLTY